MRGEHVFNLDMLKAALRTNRASRFELFMARILGKKIVTEDSGHVVTAYRWRGLLYMTDYRAAPPAAVAALKGGGQRRGPTLVKQG